MSQPAGSFRRVGIVDEDIDRVKAAVNIADVIGQHTQLKRSGRGLMGQCPFPAHNDKTASFSVNAAEGVYYCFGCLRRGDVITFLREMEGLDFETAVERLAGKAGITLRYTSKTEGEDRRRRARLIDAVARAVDFYHDRLLTAADAGEARKYLRSRGIDGEVVRTYRIGWAPDAWDALARHLSLPDKDWRDSGLGYLNSRGGQTDAFRARILFPIFDERGEPIGFGGRILPGRDGAKYKNTSDDAAIYSKSRVLYGLNWSKTDIAHVGEAIVCEGYTDVIGFALAGISRAVATCGTALTEDHVRLLQRFAKRFVLAFDADAAGQGATERVYEWEAKHQVEFAVADLPPGLDPGELARTDPERLAAAVANAIPMLGFRVRRVLDAGATKSPEGRARTAEAALAVVRQHPSDLVRDQYLMQIADRCRIDVDQLRARLRGEMRAIPVKPTRPEVDAPGAATAEDVALTLLIHRHDDIAERLGRKLFASPARRAAYDMLSEHKSFQAAVAAADDSVATLLHRLAVEEPIDDVNQVMADLARYAAGRELKKLQAHAAQINTIDELRQYSPVIDWLKHQLEQLDSVTTRDGAADQLLDWLSQHAEENRDGG
jgi:DNA primase